MRDITTKVSKHLGRWPRLSTSLTSYIAVTKEGRMLAGQKTCKEAGKDGKDESQGKDGIPEGPVGEVLEGQGSAGEVPDPG